MSYHALGPPVTYIDFWDLIVVFSLQPLPLGQNSWEAQGISNKSWSNEREGSYGTDLKTTVDSDEQEARWEKKIHQMLETATPELSTAKSTLKKYLKTRRGLFSWILYENSLKLKW